MKGVIACIITTVILPINLGLSRHFLIRRIKDVNNITIFFNQDLANIISLYHEELERRGLKDDPQNYWIWAMVYKERGVNDPIVKEAIDELIEYMKDEQWYKWMVGEEKFKIVEKIIQEKGLSTEKQKLALNRALAPYFRIWHWEDLVAGKKSEAKGELERFIEYMKQYYLYSHESQKRIKAIWEFRSIYFNTNIDVKIREEVLREIFKVLKNRFSDLETGRSAREVLMEIMRSQEPLIWQPGLEKALEYLTNEDYIQAWSPIIGAINKVKYNRNPQITEALLDILEDVVDSKVKAFIAQRAIGKLLSASGGNDNEQAISRLVNIFVHTGDKKLAEALATALSDTHSPLVLELLKDQVLDKPSSSNFKKALALRVLGNLSYPPDRIQEVVEYMGKFLKSEDEYIRTEAGFSLLILKTFANNMGIDVVLPQDIKITFPKSFRKLNPELEAISTGDNKLIVEGQEYKKDTLIPRANEFWIYTNVNNPENKIIVKGGDEYTVIFDYLGQQFYAYFLKKLGELKGMSGIGVVPAALVDLDGLKIVTKYMTGYRDSMYIPFPYYQDETIQATIFLTLLVRDMDLAPWNMLFKLRDPIITREGLSNVEPDVLLYDFGYSFFSYALGGITYFLPTVDKEEFNKVIGSSHMGKPGPVNDSYNYLLKHPELLEQYAEIFSQIITPDLIEGIVNRVFDKVKTLTGREFGDEKMIQEWIALLEDDYRNNIGRWYIKHHRNIPYYRWTLPLTMLREALKAGGMRRYLIETLKERRLQIIDLVKGGDIP